MLICPKCLCSLRERPHQLLCMVNICTGVDFVIRCIVVLLAHCHLEELAECCLPLLLHQHLHSAGCSGLGNLLLKISGIAKASQRITLLSV